MLAEIISFDGYVKKGEPKKCDWNKTTINPRCKLSSRLRSATRTGVSHTRLTTHSTLLIRHRKKSPVLLTRRSEESLTERSKCYCPAATRVRGGIVGRNRVPLNKSLVK